MVENKQSTKYWSERQEAYIAKYLGGYVQPGSGNGKFKKSDVVVNDFLIECKTAMTEKTQFAIKKEWLDKLKSEALMNNKDICALAFNFGATDKNNYFVIDEATFRTLKFAYDDFIKHN